MVACFLWRADDGVDSLSAAILMVALFLLFKFGWLEEEEEEDNDVDDDDGGGGNEEEEEETCIFKCSCG